MLEGDVLVVDDIAANLEVVSQVLEDAGCDVSVALDGDRALKLARMHPPDLILLDVQMPGIDGYETCQRLKENAVTAKIPVIFLTAQSDTQSKLQGFELGAVDYITKPFQEQELLVRVKTHLQLRRWHQQLESHVSERTCELQAALEKLNQSQLQLVQYEKMSALGSLMSGVAHELNNPLGFIDGSVRHVKTHVEDLIEHLALYQDCYPDATDDIKEDAEDINLEFLIEDLLKMLDSMEEATRRMKSMSNSLRNFSRADAEQAVPADINASLDSTLLLLKYRLGGNDVRPKIRVNRDYQSLGEIVCFPGQLYQVFMNILANMIDMFDEVAIASAETTLHQHPQAIFIRTSQLPGGGVEVSIRDNGKGMPPEVKTRIFERLFTTKPVGKGTGLGLAIAHQIVVDVHGGSITVFSTVGQGSEFVIRLPRDVEPIGS
ncbi:MAG: response regulator [Cyanobacteria bacterium J06607_13]